MIKVPVILMVLAAVLAMAGGAAGAPKRGDTVLTLDFEGPDALKGFTVTGAGVRLEAGPTGGKVLVVECTAGASPLAANAAMAVPIADFRGCKLDLSARVKAENVSARPQDWNGIKFMTPIDSPGGRQWPQAPLDVGTFDWRLVTWQASVPDDATAITLILGLEQVTGKVWFDDVKITVRRAPIVLPTPVPGKPVYKGHTLPRLRGAMVSTEIDEDGLRVLGQEWKANLIRWQLCGFKPKEGISLETYDAVLEENLKKLDRALPLCEKYGLMVVVDLHTAPGEGPSGKGLFNDPACQKKFVEAWDRMARRYKNAKAVWGYDILNEPVETSVAPGLSDWQELAEKAARAIRAVDPDRAIIIEPTGWGSPEALRDLRPMDVPNVVYSVHMYMPHKFTHQGVYDDGAVKYTYPGVVDGKKWDRAALEAALKPAVDFQKAYGVHLYLGEFSAIRWAPDGSAARYLRDCIDIFESHGWDWSYHAFREWQGWSAEHGDDKADTAPAAQPPERQKILREWYAKNEKPRW